MNIDSNILFQWVLWVLVGIVFLFIVGAAIVAIRRNTFKSYFEVLQSMVTNKEFAGVLIAGVTSVFFEKSLIAMVAVFVGFISYKAVVTNKIVSASGDNAYDFFGNDKMNNLATAIISTKTWLVLLGTGVVWYAAFFGYFEPAMVSVQIMALVAAWLTANGFNTIAIVAKGKDMSFLNPVLQQKTPQNSPQLPFQSLPVQSPALPPEPNIKPAIVKAERVPFDESIMYQKAKGYAERNFPDDLKDNLGWGILKAIDTPNVVADSEICNNAEAATDFFAWYKNIAYSAFKGEFGFEYFNIEDHFNDEKIFKCPVMKGTTNFSIYFADALKPFFAKIDGVIRQVDNGFAQVARLGEKRVDEILGLGGWTYMNALQELTLVDRPQSIYNKSY